MKNKSNHKELREKAEQLLNLSVRSSLDTVNVITREQIEHILEEMDIYRIELELQNEELKSIQDKLKISEEKYFDIFQFAPACYLTLDEHLKIREINHTGSQLLKSATIDLIGKDFRKFILPQYQDDFFFFVRDLSTERKSVDLMIMDTQQKTIDTYLEAVLYENNGEISYNFIIIDTTRFKQQVSNARAEEDRYAILSNLPEAIIVHIKGIIVFFNERAIKQFGYSNDDILGKNIFEFIHEDDRSFAQMNMEKRMQGLPFKNDYELKVLHRSGRVMTTLVSVTNIEFDNNAAEIVLVRDITERKETELKLKAYSAYHSVKSSLRGVPFEQSEPFLMNTFLQSIVSGYGLTAAVYCKYNSNKLSPELLVGNLSFSIDEFIVETEIQKVLETELPIVDNYGMLQSYRIISKNNEKDVSAAIKSESIKHFAIPLIINRAFEGAIIFFPNDLGKDSPIISLRLADLTDELQMSLTERRNRHSIESNLKLLKNEAVELSKAKTEFLANMSHEIRSPLNPIVGFTNYLLNEFRLPQDVVDILKLIEISSKQLLKTLSDVLDMSKLEQGKLNFSNSKFPMVQLIEDTTSVFIDKAKELGCDFKINISEEVQNTYLGDIYRLNQVISFLLDNAFKFSYKTKSIISLSVRKMESDNEQSNAKFDWIEFIVEDDGIGIPNDKLEYIFELFAQLDHSFSKIYGGVGIGLPLASSIVNLLGGYIEVESKQMQGSKFTITMPLYLPIDDEEIEKSDFIEDNNKVITAKKYKALIAEDDLANKFLLESILNQTKKFELYYAHNGSEVLQLFEKEKFDVILMDIKMPILDGELATKRIREIEKAKSIDNTLIIAVTAQAGLGSREKYLKAGMDDVIFKPFSNKAFIRILEKYLPL